MTSHLSVAVLSVTLVTGVWLTTSPPHNDSSATDAPAQDIEATRAYLLEAFERQKRLDLAYAGAMPDSAWRWAPTPDVRDFASQIAHITHDFFGPWRGDEGPSADSAAYLNDRATMLEEIEVGWDWAIGRYQDMSADELTEEVQFFTGQMLPRWRAGMYWIEHAMWTRGSTVPYLRLHGVEPPTISFFATG